MTTEEIERAEAAVRQAEGEYRELERAAAMLRDRLPKAQMALEAARAKASRLKRAHGRATSPQQREVDRLKQAIAAANEDRPNV